MTTIDILPSLKGAPSNNYVELYRGELRCVGKRVLQGASGVMMSMMDEYEGTILLNANDASI